MPKSKSKSNLFILYTLGDPAGIGPEILIKALSNKKTLNAINHLVVGDSDIVMRYAAPKRLKLKVHTDFKNLKLASGVINILDLRSGIKAQPGRPDKHTGRVSFEYLKEGAKIIKTYHQQVKALITLPVSKFHIQLGGYSFSGHTEFLQKEFNAYRVEMVFLTPDFNLLLLTRHIALKEVSKKLKGEDLVSRLEWISNFYEKYFKVKPRIALLGLNPHAGEGGLIGKEEEEIFIPAIKKLKSKINIEGPFPADGFFRNYKQLNFHLVISCYHDQVLPLIKALYPQAVNFTFGLPFLRFSPNHGPAFDIAGKNRADASSLIQCIKYALSLNAG